MDKMTDARAVEVLAAMRDDGGVVADADYTAAIDHVIARLREPAGVFVQLAERAVPFLRDEADKYEDDGSNEPLELAREIESALASLPSDESALPSANSAFDGGKEAAPCPHARGENCDCTQPPAESQAQGGVEVVAWIAQCELDSLVGTPEGKSAFGVVWSRPIGQAGVPLYTAPPSAPAGVEGLRDMANGWLAEAAQAEAAKSFATADARTNLAHQLLDALAQQPAAGECPHRTRCDCIAACKYGLAGEGALATQHQEPKS